jgi:hypothetical protein
MHEHPGRPAAPGSLLARPSPQGLKIPCVALDRGHPHPTGQHTPAGVGRWGAEGQGGSRKGEEVSRWWLMGGLREGVGGGGGDGGPRLLCTVCAWLWFILLNHHSPRERRSPHPDKTQRLRGQSTCPGHTASDWNWLIPKHLPGLLSPGIEGVC